VSRLRKVVDFSSVAGSPHSLAILVVEDHANTAQSIQRYLRQRGHRVHVASDVRSARALAASVKFDLLLSDIGLPDGNGWELLEELCTDRSIRAIAMSGYDTDADRARSKAAGFLEHLAKPLTPNELDRAFERAMTR